MDQENLALKTSKFQSVQCFAFGFGIYLHQLFNQTLTKNRKPQSIIF